MREDVEPWIAEVEKHLFPVLRGDARLKDAETLIGRFTSDVQRWRAGGNVRALVEDVFAALEAV